jgi:uncharacterized membrane protein YraQ (UPF0718 family)
MNREWKILGALVAIFVVAYTLPLGNPKIQEAIQEAFRLLQWYARNHTLACVVPALFIAGAIITFLSQNTVMRYLGPKSNPVIAYAVASVAGCILAVCSCSVLPMFAGIYKLGAGIGPATAFLYSGPAINVLAVFLSARVLGFPIGLGRAVGAIIFAVVIGLIMALVFRKSERAKVKAALQMPEPEKPSRSIAKTALPIAFMILFLVFSDWYNPGNVIVTTTDGQEFKAVVIHETKDTIRFQLEQDLDSSKSGDKTTLPKTEIAIMKERQTWVITIYHMRWYLSGMMGLVVILMTWRWSNREEVSLWMKNTWGFAKLLVPLLYGGVFVVGFVSVLLPEKQVAQWVGDNSIMSNFAASIIGTFWYFATLTEIPITHALMKLGMHDGPVMALLLAGPALSLPNLIVIWKVMGSLRTIVFIVLVVVMSTAAGMFFGTFWGGENSTEEVPFMEGVKPKAPQKQEEGAPLSMRTGHSVPLETVNKSLPLTVNTGLSPHYAVSKTFSTQQILVKPLINRRSHYEKVSNTGYRM